MSDTFEDECEHEKNCNSHLMQAEICRGTEQEARAQGAKQVHAQGA